MTFSVFDDTQCSLGEGPIWHPDRQTFFWFDINNCTLYEKGNGVHRHWTFDGHVSAAGLVDENTLMIAHEKALLKFDIETGQHTVLCDLEADNPITRSNDGRADPWGGFWIGTMGKQAEPGAGAYYRYYKGELRKLYGDWSIPNATCFAPDRSYTYFADTPRGKIWRVALDPDTGWPAAEREVFLDLASDQYRPDGAVTDAQGNIWCTHYGLAKLTCHAPDGSELSSQPLAARQTTCPAFGGADFTQMYLSSARQNLTEPTDFDGQTFIGTVGAVGLPEPKVLL
ncbi:SMP-30/gluconolactonase/LRE family protein [Pseudoprimorskyibacter insulae]|uniref:6-deoxy-6-sulfogluconolactonase n=1 Tax=Pseudoprimorskyibacter insulae TaxID=1695997 RepID=A0A2R8APR6_9RHOB|nr:SMP-30/gluconolactonase/LRE family protein [Pseudoprimorskyibacter insulae]SPF78005.1 6-deoxy-6-sulfogluconolactonase [Pseudoprimorskyibacter insulae]